MANPTITITGNLTQAPELRFTPNGDAVANLSIVTNGRRLNKQTNEWEDVDTSFWNCTIWRQGAEAAAEQLTKGTSVIARGTIKQRSWEDKEGNRRTSFEVDLETIGVDMAAMARRNKGGQQQGAGWSKPQGQQQAQADPWGQPQQGQAAADPWAQTSNDPAPF